MLSNEVYQKITKEELDELGMTFEEWVIANEEAIINDEEQVKGSETEVIHDDKEQSITARVSVIFKDYDFEKDELGVGSKEDYANVEDVKKALETMGYTCTIEE